jgi:hypothetical protein
MVKIRIRDKHPGSATLPPKAPHEENLTLKHGSFFIYLCYYFFPIHFTRTTDAGKVDVDTIELTEQAYS